MLLAAAADEPDADPGLGELGGLVAVLLASLEKTKSQNAVRGRSQGKKTSWIQEQIQR